MSDYTRPTYTNGYEITYNRNSDMFECLQHGALLSKKDKKPAAYKAPGLAIKFMAASGAQEAAPEPKKPAWTPPARAEIAPIEEQLAALPANAPRFVLVEVPYSTTYHEQGYGCYDRQEKELVCPHTYNGMNFKTQSREEAEKEVAYRQENAPQKVEADLYLFNMMLSDDEKDEYPQIQAGSEEEATYKRQEAEWQERKASAPKTEAVAAPVVEEKVVFITDRQYRAGETLVDDGHKYTVTKDSYWLSARDVAEMEEGFDAFTEVGWHTPAQLITEG